MYVNRVYQGEAIRTEGNAIQERQFKQGEIVTGRIQQIYPNQKAEVQIGQNRLIARLEVPLTVGNAYHFEVGLDKDTIVLRLVSEDKLSANLHNAESLLRSLGLQASKSNIQFVQDLMNSNVGFTKEQLIEGLKLLNQMKQVDGINRAIIDLIRQNLPLTKATVQAQTTLQSGPIQSLMHQALAELNQQLTSEGKTGQASQQLVSSTNQNEQTNHWKVLTQQLLDAVQKTMTRTENSGSQNNEKAALSHTLPKSTQNLLLSIAQNIEQLSGERVTPEQLRTSDIERLVVQNDRLFHFLQTTKQIPSNTTKDQWIKQWSDFLLSNNQPQGNLQEMRLPFQLNESTITNSLRQFQSFTQIVQSFESRWAHVLSNQVPLATLSEGDLRTFVQEFQRLVQLSGQRSDIAEVITRLQQMNQTEQMVRVATDWVSSHKQDMNLHMSRPVEQLFQTPSQTEVITTHLKTFLTQSGMLNEFHLGQSSRELPDLQNTLKAQIMQLVQGNHRVDLEHTPKLIHMINGMQMQSVVDTNHFVHAIYQLPGEPLGFQNDIEMEFSSKKSEDGELDPDHCRVLFYLDLSHMRETVIDMHVRDRSVILTIYNDSPVLKPIIGQFQTKLQDALTSVDYELQAINIQKSTKQEEKQPERKPISIYTEREGYDYKI